MPSSLSGNVNLFDFIGITKLNQRLQKAKDAFGPAISEVKPQFGAYMRYSAVLEGGSKYMPVGHIKTDPVTKKPMARKKPIGPHIRPAVENNAKFILQYIMKYLEVMTNQHINNVRVYSKDMVKAVLSRQWERALNDKPRQAAVAKAPFEFGFHRRSIRGYANAPDSTKILEWQSEAKSSRKGMAEQKKVKVRNRKKKSGEQLELF